MVAVICRAGKKEKAIKIKEMFERLSGNFIKRMEAVLPDSFDITHEVIRGISKKENERKMHAKRRTIKTALSFLLPIFHSNLLALKIPSFLSISLL